MNDTLAGFLAHRLRSGRARPIKGRASALPLILGVSVLASPAQATINISLSLDQPTMAAGAVTSLRYTVDNTDTVNPVAGVRWITTLPVGVEVAALVQAEHNCVTLLLVAEPGTTTIRASGWRLGAGARCSVAFNITAAGPGGFPIASGIPLGIGATGVGGFTVLTVDPDRLRVSATFLPAELEVGARTVLRLTVDNSANAAPSPLFQWAVPVGEWVFRPPGTSISDSCGQFFTSDQRGGVIFLRNGLVAASSTCVMDIPLQVRSAGRFGIRTAELVAAGQSSATAVAPLHSRLEPFSIRFQDPVRPGAVVRAVYSLSNLSRTAAAEEIGFSHDLGATVSGLSVLSLPAAPCGPGSTLAGDSVLTLSGGRLPASGSCTFTVEMQTPSAVSGDFPSSTADVQFRANGEARQWPAAADILTLLPLPSVALRFLESPLRSLDQVAVEFTLTNPSTSELTDINLSATGFPWQAADPPAVAAPWDAVTLPASGYCGVGSITAFIPTPQPLLRVARASLPAAGSCTFVVTVRLAASLEPGTYAVAVENLLGTLEGGTVVGLPGRAEVEVVRGPRLRLALDQGVVLPASTPRLSLTLAYGANAGTAATAIGFTVDLQTALAGLGHGALPADGFCGPGSSMTSGATLTVADASLAPGQTCEFSLPLNIPNNAVSGNYNLDSSPIGSTVAGGAALSAAAQGRFVVTGLSLSKSLDQNLLMPGDTADITYILRNDGNEAMSNVTLTDSPGHDVVGGSFTLLSPLSDACGSGSSLLQTGPALSLTNASLGPSSSCAIDIRVSLSPTMPAARYTLGGAKLVGITGGQLIEVYSIGEKFVVGAPLLFSAGFASPRVEPGGLAVLQIALANAHPNAAANGAGFGVQLEQALGGLLAEGLPLNGVCGAGSSLSGGSILSYSQPSIAAGADCVFTVDLRIPASAAPGAVVDLLVGPLSAVVAGLAVEAPAQTARVVVDNFVFGQSLRGPSFPGGEVTLTTRMENRRPRSMFGLTSSVSLDSVVAGLRLLSAPAEGFCGAESQVAGTGTLGFRVGELTAGSTCLFDVNLAVPETAAPGAYVMAAAELHSGAGFVAEGVGSALELATRPTVSLAFVDPVVFPQQTSRLSLAIDARTTTVSFSGMQWAIDLSQGLAVASPPAMLSTCANALLEAQAGSRRIVLSGGQTPALGSCAVEVDVVAVDPGEQRAETPSVRLRAGFLSDGINATLRVEPPPLLRVSFTPAVVGVGQESVLSLSIDNGLSTSAVTDLALTVTLPAELKFADPPEATTTCAQGGVTVQTDPDQFTFGGVNLEAGASCDIRLQVLATVGGAVQVNTGALATAETTSPAATGVLNVFDLPRLSCSFAAERIKLGETVELVCMVSNQATASVAGIEFDAELPTGLTLAEPVSLNSDCGAGIVLAGESAQSFRLQAGEVGASSSCSVRVVVRGNAVGTYDFASSPLRSVFGESALASASLIVASGKPASAGCACGASVGRKTSGILLMALALLYRRRRRSSWQS